MNKSISQPLSWNWPIAQEMLVGHFELGGQELIKRIRQSLRGGYQQLMAQSTWSKRTSRLERTASPASIKIEQIGENMDQSECVRECVSIKQRGRQVITAVRTADHRLNLFSWRVNADGSVVRTGASGPQPGRVAQIAITRARKFVTAFRTTARQLQLVSWDVSNTGAIYRAGASNTPAGEGDDEVSKVKLVALNDNLLITACTTRTGHTKLISWQLKDNDALTRLSDCTDTGDIVRELVPVVLPPTTTGLRLLTVARIKTGQLKLQIWHIANSGEITVDAGSTMTGEKISQFDAVVDAEGRLITSLRMANGRLKLIVWQLTPDGQAIHRLCDSGAKGEQIRQHSLMRYATQIMTAVQTTTGHFKLIVWALPSDIPPGGAIVCVGEGATQGAASAPIGFCQETLDGNAPIMTNSITAEGMLKLMTWRV